MIGEVKRRKRKISEETFMCVGDRIHSSALDIPSLCHYLDWRASQKLISLSADQVFYQTRAGLHGGEGFCCTVHTCRLTAFRCTRLSSTVRLSPITLPIGLQLHFSYSSPTLLLLEILTFKIVLDSLSLSLRNYWNSWSFAFLLYPFVCVSYPFILVERISDERLHGAVVCSFSLLYHKVAICPEFTCWTMCL